MFKSVKRARLASETSKDWLEMPPEMREMVIKRMDEKTLCQFSACSKLSRAGAKRSGKFMSGIIFGNNSLDIKHGSHCAYRLEFIDVPESAIDQTMVLYKTRIPAAPEQFGNCVFIVKWGEVVNGTPQELREKYIIDHFRKYGDNIREFVIEDKSCAPNGIDFRSLKNLEIIDLAFCGDLFEGIEMNQLLNAKNINSFNRLFTFDQFIQFNGNCASIKMHQFNEETITRYLNILKTSDVHKNLKECTISIADSNKRFPTAGFYKDLSKHFTIKFSKTTEDESYLSISLNFAKISIIFFGGLQGKVFNVPPRKKSRVCGMLRVPMGKKNPNGNKEKNALF